MAECAGCRQANLRLPALEQRCSRVCCAEASNASEQETRTDKQVGLFSLELHMRKACGQCLALHVLVSLAQEGLMRREQ